MGLTSGRARGAQATAVVVALLLVVVAVALGVDTFAADPGDRGDGGILMVAVQPPANLDPHFASLASEELINHQIYDWLVTLDGQNEPVPSLATKWEMSPDGKRWTFTLRDGVRFSNGEPLTADDVVYSFDRMRDPEVGAPTSALFTDIGEMESGEASHRLFSLFSLVDVSSSDSSHVVFTFDAPNPEFVKDLAEYHAVVLSRSVEDPAEEWVGTGPFMLEEYAPGERLVLVKNPYHWRKAADGARLPHLEGVTFVFSPDEGDHVDALEEGEVDFVNGLSAELAWQVQRDPDLKLLTARSNFHLLVHMRSDEGRPAADPKLRLALRMGTDYQALVAAVRPGFGTVGNGTIVGPAYGEYYWDQAPEYDPEGARRLLAEAGYGDGFTMTLHAVQLGDVNAFAVAWKKQMARIGVTVNVAPVPADVYFADEGDASWMECDFGVTNWADRATPVTYFNLAYVTGGVYNESHWSDAEFDALTKQINNELDGLERAKLYRRAQQILWERGPVLVFGHQDGVAGVSDRVDGITLPVDFAKVVFSEARFVE
jgi:peptide/nickel transport system substrate-binding protein